jgi:RNA polymerase sigma factor (TIGR02999 family)
METTQLNDWLARWRAGERQAGEELMRAAYPRLEVLARKMLAGFPNVRPVNDTQDVLQNAALRLVRSLEQVDRPPATTREFYALAAVEIRRVLLDLARDLAAMKRTGRCQQVALPDSGPPDQRDLPEDLERWAAFHEAVEQLPAEEREAVGLIFYHGWTQKQVAELFGVSERTIARRWLGACVRLERMLRGKLPRD